jgi:L-lactate utilization protein LutC
VAVETAKMKVLEVAREGLAEQLAAVLREREAQKLVLTRSGILTQLDVATALTAGGFQASWWSDTTLDAAYDADAGITDVWFAVAETGSLVVRASAEHGRAVSLVPPLHIAIVERSQIVPDLVDAMRKIAAEGAGTGTVFITGPSKTSDIEMTLVTGVHGPMEVVVVLVAAATSPPPPALT